MSLTFDDTQLLAGLDRLFQTLDHAWNAGLTDGAGILEQTGADTTAYVGMSGATRSSTTAYVMSPTQDDSARANAGYQAAVAALNGFTGHNGKPLKEDSGVVLGQDERGVLLTSFTDYGHLLEIENAGAKSWIGPTIQSEAQNVTQAIASAIKAELG